VVSGEFNPGNSAKPFNLWFLIRDPNLRNLFNHIICDRDQILFQNSLAKPDEK